MKHWKTYALWILLPELVGALSGWLTRNDTQVYEETIQRPPLSPPSLVFPIVWAILFALMGIAAARIWLSAPSPDRERGLRLFGTQLGFNFLWSLIFFHFQAFGLSVAAGALGPDPGDAPDLPPGRPGRRVAAAALPPLGELRRLSERRGLAPEPLKRALSKRSALFLYPAPWYSARTASTRSRMAAASASVSSGSFR